MKKLSQDHGPQCHELTFDSLYAEISHDWQAKAERLQARRWRKLQHGLHN